MKKQNMILILAASILLSGCGTDKNIKDDEIIVSAGNVGMDYATVSTYKRIMQAESYSYMQQYTSSDVWSEALMDDNPEYSTYGEEFEAGIAESIEEMLLSDLHKSEYDVEFTDADKEVCEEAAKAFLVNTPDEALEAAHANKDSVMEVLRLLTINTRVKNKIVCSADPQISDKEARQAGFACVTVSAKDIKDPENTAEKVLEKVHDGESLKEAAGDLPYTTGNYTVEDPEYENFVDGLIQYLEGMEVGEYSSFADEFRSFRHPIKKDIRDWDAFFYEQF